LDLQVGDLWAELRDAPAVELSAQDRGDAGPLLALRPQPM
jgi:hypothetical protein